MTISSLFEAYLRARYNITLSNFSNGVLNRILTGISVILLSLMIISFDELIKLQVPIYLTGLFTIIIYAYKKENFNIKFGINNIRNRLKEITNYGESLAGSLLIFDGLNTNFRKIRIKPDPKCPLCSKSATI